MFRYFKDSPMLSQGVLLAFNSGGDVNEIDRACQSVVVNNGIPEVASWFDSWTGLARLLTGQAGADETKGRRISAAHKYRRAAVYSAMAERYIPHTDARKARAYDGVRGAFRKYVDLSVEMMEEAVRAIRLLWEERRATFVGEYFEFHDVETFPKPLQRPLPIVMAGGADAVVERIGRLANGWIDTYLLPDAMRAHLERLYAFARQAGRAGERFEIMRSFFCSIARTDEAAQRQRLESVPGGRPTGRSNDEDREFLLVGSPETIVRQLRRYDGVGVTEFNVAFYHRDVKTALAQIPLFAEEVIPGFGPRGAI